MEVYFNHDVDEDIAHAYEDIDEILAKYNVEWCASEATEMWLEKIEIRKPDLTLVDVDICDSD